MSKTYTLYVGISLAFFVLGLGWLLLSSYLTKRKVVTLLRDYLDQKTTL